MEDRKITFIGAGNMARSLVGGLISDGCNPANIRVSDPAPACTTEMRNRFSVETADDNNAAIDDAEVVVLAVKPQILENVACEIAATVQKNRPLIISIAAGIREPDINRWLGGDLAVVRSMPNTPALVGTGASALYANTHVSESQREIAESLLRAVGIVIWVDDENLMDAVTAVSGSGPAYFFLVMEHIQAAGVELGLDPDSARLLTLQTALGAAKMALESSEEPALLRQRVTSPGGTTEAAIQSLQKGNISTLFSNALAAAADRSRELAKQLGKT